MNEEWIMWSFEKLTQWIDTSLHGCMSDGWALLVEFVLIGVAVLVAYALIALFLIYAERKITCASLNNTSTPFSPRK